MTLLAVDDRAYLSSVHTERYAVGDPLAPGLVLNAVDTAGCMWLATVDGWDSPTVVTPLDRRSEGHGAFLGESTYEERLLTVEGTVTAPTRAALLDANQRLLAAVLATLTGYVRWTHLDDNPAKGLWTRVTGRPLWRALDDRVADFGFVLVAEDPIKTGAAATVGPVRLQGTAVEGGIPAPYTMPLTFGGSVASTVVGRLPNGGNEAGHARYVVTGPVPQPVIQLSTGEFVHLRLDLGALDTATVDTAEGTVTVNGVNRYDAWGPGSVFPLVPPGGAEVRLRSFTGGADPAAGLTVLTAPAWR